MYKLNWPIDDLSKWSQFDISVGNDTAVFAGKIPAQVGQHVVKKIYDKDGYSSSQITVTISYDSSKKMMNMSHNAMMPFIKVIGFHKLA